MRSRASLSAASACAVAGLFRRVDFGRAHAHGDLGEIEAVEFQRQLLNGAVAIGAHLGDDTAHALFHVLRRLAFDREKGLET